CVLSSAAASTIAETRYSCRDPSTLDGGGRNRSRYCRQPRAYAPATASKRGRNVARAEASAAPASGPKPSASVARSWPGRPVRPVCAVCTRLPAAAEVYRPSRRPSALRSVQPSLVPANPLDVAVNAGEPTNALDTPVVASVATRAAPSVRPASPPRLLPSAGSN